MTPDTLTKRVAGGVGGQGQGKDGRLVLDAGHRRRNVTLLHESAIEDQKPVGARFGDMIVILRQGALVAGRNKQIVSTRALIRAGQPHISHPAKISVIDRAKDPRGYPNNDRSILQVDAEHGVDGGRIGRKKQRTGIQQVLGDADTLINHNPRFLEAAAQRMNRGGRHAPEEGVHTAAEIQLVVSHLNRCIIGGAVLEVQCADPGLDGIGRRYLGRYLGCVLRRGGRCVAGCSRIDVNDGERDRRRQDTIK